MLIFIYASNSKNQILLPDLVACKELCQKDLTDNYLNYFYVNVIQHLMYASIHFIISY